MWFRGLFLGPLLWIWLPWKEVEYLSLLPIFRWIITFPEIDGKYLLLKIVICIWGQSERFHILHHTDSTYLMITLSIFNHFNIVPLICTSLWLNKTCSLFFCSVHFNVAHNKAGWWLRHKFKRAQILFKSFNISRVCGHLTQITI